jgi:hypothetical protein
VRIAYPKHRASLALLNYHTSSRLVYSDLEASTEHVAPWLLRCGGLRIEEGDYIAHFCILASGSMGAYIDRWGARIRGGGTGETTSNTTTSSSSTPGGERSVAGD